MSEKGEKSPPKPNIEKLYPPTFYCKYYRFYIKIGQGENGAVYTVRNLATKCVENIAAKRPFSGRGGEERLSMTTRRRAEESYLDDVEDAKDVFAEFKLAKLAQGPHISVVYNFSYIKGIPCILMKKYTGNLADLVFGKRNLTVEEKHSIITQCVMAVFDLQHLTPLKVIHRDIKLDNFLYEEVQGGYFIVLCDLGFAYLVDPNRPSSPNYFSGSLLYAPKEALRFLTGQEGFYSLKSDIYSLGMLIVEVLTRERFEFTDSEEELLRIIVEDDERPPIPRLVQDSHYSDLVYRCLDPEESNRPSIENVLRSVRSVDVRPTSLPNSPIESFISRINPGLLSSVNPTALVAPLQEILTNRVRDLSPEKSLQLISSFVDLVTDKKSSSSRVSMAALRRADIEIGPIQRLGWVEFLEEVVRLKTFNFIWNDLRKTAFILKGAKKERQYFVRNSPNKCGSLKLVVRSSLHHISETTIELNSSNRPDFYFRIRNLHFRLLSDLIEDQIRQLNLNVDEIQFEKNEYDEDVQ